MRPFIICPISICVNPNLAADNTSRSLSPILEIQLTRLKLKLKTSFFLSLAFQVSNIRKPGLGSEDGEIMGAIPLASDAPLAGCRCVRGPNLR